MFCSYCGSPLAEGASFCNICGKCVNGGAVANNPASDTWSATNIQMQQYQVQKTVIRQSEINSIANAYYYFSQKSSQFDEYDQACDKLNYYSRGAKSALLVWGCIASTLGLLCLIVYLGLGVSVVPAILLLLFPGSLMITGGILMKVNNHKKFAYFKKKYAELSKELYDHYISYPNCPVGPEYVNPQILGLLLNVLQSGRADTVKESINLVIDETHRAKVREYLAAIEYNTAAINAKTSVTTTFVAASFFI